MAGGPRSSEHDPDLPKEEPLSEGYPQPVTATATRANPQDALTDWAATAPRDGHWVYHLCAPLPGVDPEQAVAHVYVGVTSHLHDRLRAHSRKWWWPALDPTLCELVPCGSRQEAEQLEAALIHLYQPAMNRAGRLLVVGR